MENERIYTSLLGSPDRRLPFSCLEEVDTLPKTGGESFVYELPEEFGGERDWVLKVSPPSRLKEYSGREIEDRLVMSKLVYELLNKYFPQTGREPKIILPKTFFVLGEGMVVCKKQGSFGAGLEQRVGGVEEIEGAKDYILQENMGGQWISARNLPDTHLMDKATLEVFREFLEGFCRLDKDRVTVNGDWSQKLSLLTDGRSVNVGLLPLVEFQPDIEKIKRYRSKDLETLNPTTVRNLFGGENIKMKLGEDNCYHLVLFDYGRGGTLFELKNILAFVLNAEEKKERAQLLEQKNLSDEHRERLRVLDKKDEKYRILRAEIVRRRLWLLKLLLMYKSNRDAYRNVLKEMGQKIADSLKDRLEHVNTL